MSIEILSQLTHEFVSWLLAPVLFLLMVAVATAIWEVGVSISERFWLLPRLSRSGRPEQVTELGRRRIERADLLARVGPMLGLMGTLIPLGPGLAALGQGELEALAEAVTVAFDTTVMGLLTGVVGFILARLRRRWYDNVLGALEASGAALEPVPTPAMPQEPA
ncbi:MotA/TolQ/ExbB proton channel family protein [Halomonas ventosae]|uniref:Outer membrane transport energization protein ExbB n=1 Tax=Halomonas ventosae TaxID=229007 RepID=A0A2T0VS74_9GAMM|nr:MotA/TolQ/ExbB proton channel family protein [Halomonas ventosae]PRY73445.1 outer membrane transport energization protein ExbB [Halomonas ventosae]